MRESTDPGPTAPGDGAPSSTAPPAPGRSHMWVGVGLALVLAAGGGVAWRAHARSHESTDDAFIEGRVIPVGTQISGTVQRVLVRDNQEVQQGEPLLVLDRAEPRLRVARAQASLQAALQRQSSARAQLRVVGQTTEGALAEASWALRATQRGIERAQAQARAARAQLDLTRTRAVAARQHTETTRLQAARTAAALPALQAEAQRTEREQQRFATLLAEDEVSLSHCERVRVAHREAQSRLEAARQSVAASQSEHDEAQVAAQAAQEAVRQQESTVHEAEARVHEARAQAHAASGRLQVAQAAPAQTAASRSQAAIANAGVDEARAALAQARLELARCQVVAPVAGRVTRKSVEAGMYVQPGQALLSLVAPDLWVVANFKETQLRAMRVGQAATVRVDAYPGRLLHAHVESLQAGTGARFSLLPAENASGNYVKVVQRVPVKLVFDEPAKHLLDLRPGLSVEPTIHLR